MMPPKEPRGDEGRVGDVESPDEMEPERPSWGGGIVAGMAAAEDLSRWARAEGESEAGSWEGQRGALRSSSVARRSLCAGLTS